MTPEAMATADPMFTVLAANPALDMTTLALDGVVVLLKAINGELVSTEVDLSETAADLKTIIGSRTIHHKGRRRACGKRKRPLCICLEGFHRCKD
jgi:hypothetical protein